MARKASLDMAHPRDHSPEGSLPVVILGSGMAALGAATRLQAERRPFLVFDSATKPGGHTASTRHPDGFVFDDGPHVSFTRNDRIRGLLTGFVGGAERTVPAFINNYWHGRWLTHPVQMHLGELPPDLIVPILLDYIGVHATQPGDTANYREWLHAAYGATFARTFPEVYGRKYHTTTVEALTTDWLGPRMYRPDLEEILAGALSIVRPNQHYVTEFRYPLHGGFASYLSPFEGMPQLHLGHEAVAIDPEARVVAFANGSRQAYAGMISTVPLPVLVGLLRDVPPSVAAAGARLSFTSVVVVNLGIARDSISEAEISYVYDEDIAFARLNFPHRLSPHNVPPGTSSIQAELYFSERYRPLDTTPEALIGRTVADLTRMAVLLKDDRIIHRDAHLTRFANIIYDRDRGPAVTEIHEHLRAVGVHACGRYGEWNHLWTDEAFQSGERAAEAVLGEVSVRPAS